MLIGDIQTELCYQVADNSLQSIRLGLLRQYQCHASVLLYCRFQRHSHFSPRFISLDSFPLLVTGPSKLINKSLDTISRDEEALFRY